jgi:predicted ATPase/class 3 adenylate cyclase
MTGRSSHDALALPAGTVTFVFTDIEGSTALLDELGELYGEVLFSHHHLLREVWVAHDGVEVSTEGDAFFVAFASASQAVAATAAGQVALSAHIWPHGRPLGVRMGVHTGEPRIREGDYWGPDVHYAARVASAARGGQVLVTAAAAALAADASLASLGRHRLKDFPEPRELFALGPGPHPSPRTLDPLRSNLPSAPTPLVGREQEVEELVAMMTGDARFVTLTGTGGTGKTRLALAVAERLVDEFADGAFLVELAELTSDQGVTGSIAGVLGIRGGVEGLSGALGDREILLVLDNFEHVLNAAPVMAELRAGAPGVRLLVTSQAPLRVAGEQIYALSPLDVPKDDALTSSIDAPAVALLIAAAQRAGSQIVLGDSNAAAIAALCRELDGSPLAIELAAARLALLDPAELLERLRRSPDALGKGGRDLPARHRGLRAAMRWSYGLLDPQAASLFRRLGHFSGEASLERIEQVCDEGVDDVLESLARLVDLSLVRRTRDGRFALASALRSFARELLEASGEEETLRRRHAESLVGDWLPIALEQPLASHRELSRGVLAEQSDVVAHFEWAGGVDLGLAGRLLACTWGPLHNLFGLGRWRDMIAQIVAAWPAGGRIGTLVALAARLAALEGSGGQGFLALAREADTEGDRLFEGWLRATCAVLDALHAPEPGWIDGARDLVTGLRASPVSGLRDLGADIEGHLLLLEERFDAAGEAFEATVRRGADTWVASTALYMIGDCHLFAGRPQAALPAYARGVLDARESGSRIDMAFQGEGIVCALADLGEHASALEALGASDSLNGDRFQPREMNSRWGAIAAGRITAARDALGTGEADAAYARGAALGVDAAVRLLLAFDEQESRQV